MNANQRREADEKAADARRRARRWLDVDLKHSTLWQGDSWECFRCAASGTLETAESAKPCGAAS